ncbi:hypothetical protein [Staphylococcus sp. LKG3-3]|uniref:hypothetical protein n=1 Tax=Staphylococcus sp. LKG3-3 TaxID=3399685 RepID=UPI003D59582D
MPSKYRVVEYLMQEYQEMLNQLIEFEEWLENNPDEYEWNYKKEIPTKARLKRIRQLLNETMMKVEK